MIQHLRPLVCGGKPNKLRYDIWMPLLRQRGWDGGPSAPFTPRQDSTLTQSRERVGFLESHIVVVKLNRLVLCTVPPEEFCSKALMQNLAAMGVQRLLFELFECLFPKEHCCHNCF